jgi:hypothetical protein
MNGLQLTASGREGSGLLGHDAVSLGQEVRQTDRQAGRQAGRQTDKGQEFRATCTASYPRNLKSRYVTWSPARVERSSLQLLFRTPMLQPPVSCATLARSKQ